MSEPDNFLSRWSRRKREARRDEAPEEASRESGVLPEAAASPRQELDAEAEPAFDVSSLPSIESITANSDIRAFLQKGVPSELTRAALRRVWASDPAIRDFVEVAENQWDFATGRDLPGFGPLQPSDDIRRLVAEVFEGTFKAPLQASDGREGQVAQTTEERHDASQADIPKQPSSDSPGSDLLTVQQEEMVHRKENHAATQGQQESQDAHSRSRNRHGRALPQ